MKTDETAVPLRQDDGAGADTGRPVCLIVLAHPLPDSLAAALARTAEAAAMARGWQVRWRDLCAEGFQPALTARERASFAGAAYDRSQLGDAPEDLLRAEILVLVYPTWWFGFPAVLKGWFDRVWAPGLAYDVPAGGAPLVPRLVRLRHVLAVTTLGSPWWIDWLVLHRPLPRVLKRAIIGPCAPQARVTCLSLYGADAPTGRRVERFMRRIGDAVAALVL